MALILKLLEDAKNGYCHKPQRELAKVDCVCKNPKCITTVESDLPQKFSLRDETHKVYRCEYCEKKNRDLLD
ncbi:MAG: hypothetical protein WCR54_07100 [Clostridia bacterium]